MLKVDAEKIRNLLTSQQSDLISDGAASLINSISQKYEKTNVFYQSAYHGTPHKFDNFSTEHIGSGEGNQAHGWGLYFAGNKNVSENYRKKLAQAPANINPLYKQLYLNGGKSNVIKHIQDSLDTLKQAFNNAKNNNEKKEYTENIKNLEKQISIIEDFEDDNLGQLYEVDIPDDDVLLDEDLPISKQPKKVQEVIKQYFLENYLKNNGNQRDFDYEKALEFLGIKNGKDFYNSFADWELAKFEKNPEKYPFKPATIYFDGKEKFELASKKLNSMGIKGIKYNGRQDGECYVVFDDKQLYD